MTDVALLLGGAALLYFGAEWFVGGASSLALALRIPQILVGLTVVAYGTSAPEVVVGVEAAAKGHGAVALGNVIGSNVANIGLILGIAALIRPARVDGELRTRELPMLLLSTLAIALVLVDGAVARWEAAALLTAAAAYTLWMVRLARRAATVARARDDAAAAKQAAGDAGAPAGRGMLRSGVIATGGLLVLLVGGNLFVDGAVGIARAFGMSQQLVGLTIVAVGTSLPELVTSAIAAARGHSDLAVGNVVGSNIFNVLLCLGAAALAGDVGSPLHTVAVDLGALAVMTVVAAIFLRTARTMTRFEGGLSLAMYVGFTALVIARG